MLDQEAKFIDPAGKRDGECVSGIKIAVSNAEPLLVGFRISPTEWKVASPKVN